MDKKSKEVLRRYKKARQHAESSSSSSSSDSSYSSSESESSGRKAAAERHRKKKARQTARRSSSSSDNERKREKRERDHCQRKLEAKRNHLKRKLKEAKLKKRAAVAAAALSGHSHRALSPATQAKLKKLAERKHQRAASKERREREKEKHRAAAREQHERAHHRIGSRSPTKVTKIRIHQDVKRQKSPPPHMHHQLMTREKIIIQTRTRERTPPRHHEELARERDRKDRDRERAEREAARDKERAEALARCQERQRERERLAREKLRREEEGDKYGLVEEHGERLLPRPGERVLGVGLGAGPRSYNSRERESLERPMERPRHLPGKHDIGAFERERDYIDVDRRALLDREEIRREREYLAMRRRDLSPVADHYVGGRLRDPRDLYPENERERIYGRSYLEDDRRLHECDNWMEPRDLRERGGPLKERHEPREYRDMKRDLLFAGERDRDRILRDREPRAGLPPLPPPSARAMEWENEWEGGGRERDWHGHDAAPLAGHGAGSGGGFVGGPKHAAAKAADAVAREQRAPSEPDWDAHELAEKSSPAAGKAAELPPVREPPAYSGAATIREVVASREVLPVPREKHPERRWVNDWHDDDEAAPRSTGSPASAAPPIPHHRAGRGFRRGGDHGERGSSGGSMRPHPPPLMTLPVHPPGGYHGPGPRFPPKRNMTYTNPNLLKKQQVALAATKTAVQASAVVAATTAVAAAKAAAQSSATATTNPGILGQGAGGARPPNEKPDGAGDGCAQEEGAAGGTPEASVEAAVSAENKAVADLSEISDSDDEILTSIDPKPPAGESSDAADNIPGTSSGSAGAAVKPLAAATTADSTAEELCGAAGNANNDDDEMLDFEEISDGELEEDTKIKPTGIGDALGVDWASLMAETRRPTKDAPPTGGQQLSSAKQRWEPHRIFLNIGYSLKMGGAEYGLRLLADARKKVALEDAMMNRGGDGDTGLTPPAEKDVKSEDIKCEDGKSDAIKCEDIKTEVVEEEARPEPGNAKEDEPQEFKVYEEDEDEERKKAGQPHQFAFVQVGEAKQERELHDLFTCGPYSRALCARRDMALRRRLLGLPIEDDIVPKDIPTVSEKMKQRAIELFQRRLEVT